MTIQDRAAKVLQKIDAALALAEKATPGPWKWDGKDVWHRGESYESKTDPHLYTGIQGDERLQTSLTFRANTAFIAASRTLLPTSLCCLKTAIEGLLKIMKRSHPYWLDDEIALTILCDQWEAEQ